MEKMSNEDYETWMRDHHRMFFSRAGFIRKNFREGKITKEEYEEKIHDLLETSLDQYVDFIRKNA